MPHLRSAGAGETGAGRLSISDTTHGVTGLNIIAEHDLALAAAAREARGQLTGGWPTGVHPTAMGAFLGRALEGKGSGTCCADALQMPHLKALGCSEGIVALRVRKELVDRFATQPLAAWTEFFDGIDCCVTPVLTLAEAREHKLFKN